MQGSGPSDGWQLEDGRTVCQACCVADVKKIVNRDIASEEAAWRVIVAALKEAGVTNVDHNAASIIARLSQAGMLVVAENVSVSICINGQPIHARTAVNHGEQPSGFTKFLLDDGSTVLHKPGDGVVALAIQLLKSIKENGKT
jgi:hypothetical protein